MRCARFCSVLVLTCALLGCTASENSSSAPAKPRETDLVFPGRPVVGKKPPMPAPVNVPNPPGVRVETFVSGLVVPWDIAFPSKNRVYITERPGRVRLVANGKLAAKPYATVDRAVHTGEGGLMGMALAPDYATSHKVYLMYTYRSAGRTFNRVSVFNDTGSTLADEKTLIEGIRGASYHDGGALRFGPDGMLYVGTGDGGDPQSAQDKGSLNGKILRMTPEGKPPAGNPYTGSLVYALGFRNVQGLAWNPADHDLWATNHGPSGEFGLEAKDSVFIVRKGGNYGWPIALGVTDVEGVTPPVLWFPDSAVPPGLAVFYGAAAISRLKGNFLFTSLRGEHLARVVLTGGRNISRIERWFATGVHEGRYGRLRAVVEAPDGSLYVSTSNRDGRGTSVPAMIVFCA